MGPSRMDFAVQRCKNLLKRNQKFHFYLLQRLLT